MSATPIGDRVSDLRSGGWARYMECLDAEELGVRLHALPPAAVSGDGCAATLDARHTESAAKEAASIRGVLSLARPAPEESEPAGPGSR